MRCQSCSSENLPIRETSVMVGSRICHPRHCSQCGNALTEKCPVCTHHHPIGTKFCQANGASIAKWRQEENLWKVLVQAAEATITVRPASRRFFAFLAMLPALYFVGGWWVVELLRVRTDPWTSGWDIAWGVFFAVVTTLLAAVLSLIIPFSIIDGIEDGRRRKLFQAQRFTVFELKEPEPR